MTTAEQARTPFAPLVRAAILPGLLVGALSSGIGLLVAETPGLWGAVIGALLVTAFFSLGQVVLQVVRSVHPSLFLLVGLLTYLLQIVILLAVFASFSRHESWEDTISSTALGLTIIACTAIWTVGLVVASTRERIVLYDLGGEPR